MTDKVQKIREKVEKLHGNPYYMMAIKDVLEILDKQKEPESEFLNIESMIESYKQRLISQANGVKSSPLVDMCLASYKHGINETLDTLKLSNVERTVKNWKEPTREDYEIYGSVAAVKALDRKRVCPQLKGNALHKFKNEFNTIKQIVHLLYNYEDPFCHRVALHWASWGAYNLKSFGNINEKEKAKMDISEESVSEKLEEAAEKYAYELCPSIGVANTEAEQSFKAGAKWQKEQIEEALLSEVLPCFMHGGEADEVVAKLDEVLNQKK